MSCTNIDISRVLDSIIVNDYIYSIVQWNNRAEYNEVIYYSDTGTTIPLSLLKVDKDDFSIIDFKHILYEFSATTYDISNIKNVKMRTNKTQTKINILINTFCDNDDTTVFVSNPDKSEYYSGITNTYNGTTLIEQEIRYLVGYVQFRNIETHNVVIHLSNRPPSGTCFNIGEFITLKDMDIFNGRHEIKSIWIDGDGNVGALYLTLPQTKYPTHDESNNTITYRNWEQKAEIILDDQHFDKLRLRVTNYESTDTIEITDIDDNSISFEENNTILARYKNFIGLDTNTDYVDVLFTSGLSYKYITQVHSSTSTETGPIISELISDEFNNLYTFGLGTNFDGVTEIQVGDFSPINPPIIKASDRLAIISKFDENKNTIWTNSFTLSPGSIFDNPILVYSDNEIYMTFNFSGTVIISDETYTTPLNIINSIGFKVNVETGEIMRTKFLSSNIYNSVKDICIDEDYIYMVGEFKGESHFDLNTIFSNGAGGYLMKARKLDGLIINVIDFYTDDELNISGVNIDNENIYISGSWSGNIYINDIIRTSQFEDFFITNIKKNDI